MDRVFQGLRGISREQSLREILRSSPASLRKTPSFLTLFLKFSLYFKFIYFQVLKYKNYPKTATFLFVFCLFKPQPKAKPSQELKEGLLCRPYILVPCKQVSVLIITSFINLFLYKEKKCCNFCLPTLGKQISQRLFGKGELYGPIRCVYQNFDLIQETWLVKC